MYRRLRVVASARTHELREVIPDAVAASPLVFIDLGAAEGFTPLALLPRAGQSKSMRLRSPARGECRRLAE